MQGPGSFAQTDTLNIPVVDPAHVDLGLRLYLYDMFDRNGAPYDESANDTVAMDFSHTVKIVGIQALDSQGAAVALNSVTGSDGMLYPVAAVPEPSEALLLSAGLALVGWSVRRRTRVAA